MKCSLRVLLGYTVAPNGAATQGQPYQGVLCAWRRCVRCLRAAAVVRALRLRAGLVGALLATRPGGSGACVCLLAGLAANARTFRSVLAHLNIEKEHL